MFKNLMLLVFCWNTWALGAPIPSSPATSPKPLALVYKGPGSCGEDEGDCSKAAADVAKLAGLETRYVGPEALNAKSTEADYQKLFSEAAIWLQPGGHSRVFIQNATPQLKTAIRRFVSEGGGYTGFCAGAFASTVKNGTLDLDALGIFPGKTKGYPFPLYLEIYDFLFPNSAMSRVYPIEWQGKIRHLYWEEGPYLDDLPPTAEVIAKYPNGKIAAARSTYEKGRVFVTGAHPEAPIDWRENPHLDDPDGTDFDLAVDMINWSKKKSP